MPAEKPDRHACIDGRGTFLQEIPHVLGRFTPAALAGSPSTRRQVRDARHAHARLPPPARPGGPDSLRPSVKRTSCGFHPCHTSPASNKTEAAHDSIGGFEADQRGVNHAIQ